MSADALSADALAGARTAQVAAAASTYPHAVLAADAGAPSADAGLDAGAPSADAGLTAYDLPSDLARRVAAYLFAPPPAETCTIYAVDEPTRNVRREALDATRRAAAFVAACPRAALRRALRDDLDDAERRRGLGGMTVIEAEAWLREQGYDGELATPLSAGRRMLEIIKEHYEDQTSPEALEEPLRIAFGEAPSVFIRHKLTLVDEVRALLAFGAIPDVQDSDGRTALHDVCLGAHLSASTKQMLQMTEDLVSAGADVNRECGSYPHYGRTPLAFTMATMQGMKLDDGVESHIEQGMNLAAIARCLTLNGTRVHEAEHAYTSYHRSHWRPNLRFQEIIAVHMRFLRDAGAWVSSGVETEMVRTFMKRLLDLTAVLWVSTIATEREALEHVLPFYDLRPRAADDFEAFLVEFVGNFSKYAGRQ